MADALRSQSITAVIPNYSGAQLLPKHIPAVLACLQTGDELIIVDDASPDESVLWLKNKFNLSFESASHLSGKWSLGKKSGPCNVLVNETNRRFGATCNYGVSQSQNELIFLINSDVSPQSNCRYELIKWFTSADVFAVGCLEYENNVGGEESGQNELWFEKGIFMHSKSSLMKTGPTAWVSGGSGMFRKSVWKKLGGFDLSFAPAYWEDIDLSFRARATGYSVLFDRAAVVLHQHESTNKLTFNAKQLLNMSWRSADRFAKKHATATQLFEYYFWRPYWWWHRSRELWSHSPKYLKK